MSDSNPSVLFALYEHKKLDKQKASEYLKSIIENEQNEDIRVEALKYLGKLKLKASEIYSFIENLLISDQSEKVRVESANLIFHDFLEEGEPALLHLVEHEKSADVLNMLYKTLESLETEESAQFLRQMEENLGRNYLLQFDITPKEALGLKLISLETGREVIHIGYWGDASCVAIEPHNGKVITLVIHGIKFPEIKYIEFFSELESLTISECDVKEIKNLDHLRNLKYLSLYYNNITDIRGLNQLINLEELDLTYNPITEIKGLDGLPNLESVDFEDTDLTYEAINEYFEKINKKNVKFYINPD